MQDHIDLSNACRELYFSRVEKANITRENLNETLEMNESIAMNSMDIAMTELRTEMVRICKTYIYIFINISLSLSLKYTACDSLAVTCCSILWKLRYK